MKVRDIVVEKINNDIATKGWHAEKVITVPNIGELYLRARNTSHVTPPQFIVDVDTPDGKNIGYFRFLVMDWEPPKTSWFASKSKKDPYVMGGNVMVWNEYQKKGIARQVYQWVKSLGNDLRPSTTQTAAGKSMWRSFAKNPLDESHEEFEGMTIEMIKNGHVLVINALDDWGNNVLGHVAFNIGDDNDLDPQELEVDERYQGQGIARVMYDYAKSKGYEIHRSYDQTPAGAGFWNKHRGEDVRVWEQDITEARRNPDQNIKYGSGKFELIAFAEDIRDKENWGVSMTAEPKLGINPRVGISEDTPKGIYFYPLEYFIHTARRYASLPWGDNMPYMQLFQYDRSGEMTQQTQVDPAQLKQALSQYCPEEVMQQVLDEPDSLYDGTPYWFIYDCLSRLGKSDETNIIRWNKVLRDLGFTSVFDPGRGWIAYGEPTQGVILDPRIIKQHRMFVNRNPTGLNWRYDINRLADAINWSDYYNSELQRQQVPYGHPDRQKTMLAVANTMLKPFLGKTKEEAKEMGLDQALKTASDKVIEILKQDAVQEGVAEAFDRPYKTKTEKSDYGDVDMLAKLPDGTNLSIMFNHEGDNEWQVEFYRDNSQEVTGQGDAQRIFATVLASIQKFVKKYQPDVIKFSAEKSNSSDSRSSLYDRLVARFAQQLGYNDYSEEYMGTTMYELSKQPQGMAENFADGKNPGRKGLSKRMGVNTKASVSSLRKTAKHSTGEKQRMAHWLANMKAGRAKAKKK